MTTRKPSSVEKLDPWCPAVEWRGEVFVAVPDFWAGMFTGWLNCETDSDIVGRSVWHSEVRPLTRAARDVLRCVRGR